MKRTKHKWVIEGVCSDPRIGNYYNNPSFGYGRYCLPKDTKQLLANFRDVPHRIIKAVVETNAVRKEHIAEMVLRRNPKVVGVFRLIMKKDSDNFRHAAILDTIKILKDKGAEVVIYEPLIKESEFMGYKIGKNMNQFEMISFEMISYVISGNRVFEDPGDVRGRVFTGRLLSRER
jgi:UDPglucose 6-dehydrogenase